ncbi:hypothetical protein ABEB36_004898 [Hypothenemus hampei]|uniref:Gustatory receptor n=1 Tax=Hypothenemus hampei TaxID=57062 RepID=A0ABD1EWP7_HYPHA
MRRSPYKRSVNGVHSIGLKLTVLCQWAWIRKTYIMLGIGFMVFSYAYVAYRKIYHPAVNTNNIILVLDLVSLLILSVGNIIGTFTMSTYKQHEDLYIKVIDYISSKPEANVKFGIMSYTFWILSNLALVLNAYLFTTYGSFHDYLLYGLRDVHMCLMTMLTLTVAEITHALKEMFLDIQQKLSKACDHFLKDYPHKTLFVLKTLATIQQKEEELTTFSNRLRRIIIDHNTLCQNVDEFNTAVGLSNLIIVVAVVISIIWPITIFIQYNLPNLIHKNDGLDILEISAHILWILLTITQAIHITKTGYKLTKSGRNIAIYCYRILQRIQHTDEAVFVVWHKNMDEIRCLLTLLAKQADTRCPILSAYGLFSINLGILGAMATNATAFIIIVVQFILNNKH